MLSKALKICCASLFCAALMAQAGCACCAPSKATVTETKTPCARGPCDKDYGEMTAALPPNAKPGECYAKVFVPPTFKTVTERIKVRDASETIEVIPAKYEWVEEKVLVKDASTELEALPAEFADGEQTIQTNPGHTDWEVNKNVRCVTPKGQPAKDVFCLVNHPPEQTTIHTQNQVQPARVREIPVPAKYETVRREKLVCAATTKKVCIPAEYQDVEKTVKVCPGRMAWKLIDCGDKGAETAAAESSETVTVNANPANQR